MHKVSRTRMPYFGMVLVLGFVIGCGGSTSTDPANERACPTGDEACPCYSNRTCNDSLVCLSGVCVEDDTGGEGGDGTAGEGGEAPSADDDGGDVPSVAGATGGGGTLSTGGVDATGGTETGGTDTGGTVATGGTETGGIESGGTVPTGGTATGGTTTGGTETGGVGTGGTDDKEPVCEVKHLTNSRNSERVNAAVCWGVSLELSSVTCDLLEDGALVYCEGDDIWYQVRHHDLDGVTNGFIYQAPLSEDTGELVGVIYQGADGAFRYDAPDLSYEIGYCTVVGDVLNMCVW